MSFKRLVFGAAVVLVAFAGSAQATLLTLTSGGGESGGTLSGFDLNGSTGLSDGDSITIFESGDMGGLLLSSTATVTFTYLGSEAAKDNSFSYPGVAFNNGGTPVPTTIDVLGVLPGLIDFIFASNGVTAQNSVGGGNINGSLAIAFAVDPNDANSWIALLGDGTGDRDFDDLAVRISAVPLPPAIWLLFSAIIGLITFSRKRHQITKTAG